MFLNIIQVEFSTIQSSIFIQIGYRFQLANFRLGVWTTGTNTPCFRTPAQVRPGSSRAWFAFREESFKVVGAAALPSHGHTTP
jgi:hypothetical protein